MRSQMGICLAFATMFLVGCGAKYGSPVKVTGKVTVDDKPLPNAIVTANVSETREAEFRSFQATTGAGGEFEFPAIYPGEYSVTVAEGIASAAADADLGKQSAMPAVLRPAGGGADTKLTVGDSPSTLEIKLTKKR